MTFHLLCVHIILHTFFFAPFIIYVEYNRLSMSANSVGGGPFVPKSEPTQYVMHVLIICKLKRVGSKATEKK